jgi:hypothetical protein
VQNAAVGCVIGAGTHGVVKKFFPEPDPAAGAGDTSSSTPSETPSGSGGPKAAQSVENYKDGLTPRPSTTTGDAYNFQRTYAGPNEFRLTGGGTAVNADGIDVASGRVLETKYVANPGRSPYISGSDIPDFLRERILLQQEDEFSRYARVIADPNNPLTGVRVITNNPAAVPYFQALLARYGIPGEVIVRP